MNLPELQGIWEGRSSRGLCVDTIFTSGEIPSAILLFAPCLEDRGDETDESTLENTNVLKIIDESFQCTGPGKATFVAQDFNTGLYGCERFERAEDTLKIVISGGFGTRLAAAENCPRTVDDGDEVLELDSKSGTKDRSTFSCT